jgi:hypothetical protein
MLQTGRLWVPLPLRPLDFFNWPKPSSRTMALGTIQGLTEMTTRNLPGVVKGGRRLRLTTSPPSTCMSRLSRNVGTATSHNPVGLHGLVHGWLYLSSDIYVYIYILIKCAFNTCPFLSQVTYNGQFRLSIIKFWSSPNVSVNIVVVIIRVNVIGGYGSDRFIVNPWSLVDCYQRFGGTFSLHLHGG